MKKILLTLLLIAPMCLFAQLTWEFDNASDVELVASPQQTGVWVYTARATYAVSGGVLKVSNYTHVDPWMRYNLNATIDGKDYKVLKIRLKNNSSYTKAQFFWIDAAGAYNWDFEITANDLDFKEYVLDLTTTAPPTLDANGNVTIPGHTWSDKGEITAIRFDLPGRLTTGTVPDNTSFFEVDYIRLLTTLPVRLIDFNAEALSSGKVQLNWRTADERNNDFFKIERRNANGDFVEIGTIKGKNNSAIATYSFVDNSPANGTNYYRLTQYDTDGKSEVLGIKTAVLNFDSEEITVYPNPVSNNRINVSVKSDTKFPLIVNLYDLSGKLVLTEKFESKKDVYEIAPKTTLNSGIYLLKVGSHSKTIKWL